MLVLIGLQVYLLNQKNLLLIRNQANQSWLCLRQRLIFNFILVFLLKKKKNMGKFSNQIEMLLLDGIFKIPIKVLGESNKIARKRP